MSFLKSSIESWLLDWQLRIFLLLSAICLPIIFAFDFRAIESSITTVISFVFIFFGSRFYQTDNSENWLHFSFFNSVKNVIGGVFILIGWAGFLRGVLAVALASLISRIS